MIYELKAGGCKGPVFFIGAQGICPGLFDPLKLYKFSDMWLILIINDVYEVQSTF